MDPTREEKEEEGGHMCDGKLRVTFGRRRRSSGDWNKLGDRSFVDVNTSLPR